MAGLSTGAGPPVNLYHEKSMILPDVSRVLACLYEKDVKFETFKASYKDILSLQASRSVPVPFYDGPVFLQDSRVICRYIAETYEHQGYPFLLGKDVLERASIEQWLRNEEHAFDPPSRALFCHLAFPVRNEDDNNNEAIDREKRKLEEVLEVYEQRLGESKFLAGNKFTLADLVHLPGTHHVIASERFAYLYDSRKNVQRWWNTISARDSWQQVLRDMKTVEEQHKDEELEQQRRRLQQQQQQQWQTEHLPLYGGHDIRIDPGKQEGTKSQTVLFPPHITGTIITSVPPAPQHENTSDHKPPSPIQSTKSSFFNPPSTPTTTKTHQRTDAKKPSDNEAPSKTSQRPPKEAPDKPHHSDFFKTSGHKDESESLAKHSPQGSTKISGASQTSEAVAPDKPSSGSAKDSHKFDEPDSGEVVNEPFGVRPQVAKPAPLPYTKPDTQKPQTPYAKPPEQRVPGPFVGPEAGEKQKSAVDTPYPRGRSNTGAPVAAKRAIEAGQDRAPTSQAQEVPSGVQDVQKQAKALPADQKVSQASSLQVESKQDTQDGIDEDTADERGAPKQAPTDPRVRVSSDEQSDKSSIMGGRASEATTRETLPSDSRGTSASIQEAILDARGKKASGGQEEISVVPDTGDRDTTKKSVTDKRAAEPTSGSQQTTEPVKGVGPTSSENPGDKSTRVATTDPSVAMSAPVRAPASGGQSASSVPRGGNLDANGKEAAKPRSMLPTAPGRPAPIPDTPIRTASGQMSSQSLPLSSLSDTRNEKTGIAEISQTSSVAPNEQPGGRVPRNAGASSFVPSPKKSQDINETYNEVAAEQQLQRDQSRAQPAENKEQGDDAAPVTNIGKPKEGVSLVNDSNNNTGQAQATTDAPSKLKIQSDQNKPQPSEDGGKQTNKTAYSPSLSTSNELSPSPPEKSMQQQQLQGDRSGISLQDNAKQGSEAAPLVSGTGQQKKKDLPTTADRNIGKTPGEVNSEEKTSSDTQQVKNNKSGRKSDSLSQPTQFEGNKGHLPESERRNS